MKKIIKTNDATKGGEFVGESHQGENGGMRAIVVDNGKQPILVEGSEVIINKKSVNSKKELTVKGTPKEILSTINQLDGNGVAIGDEDAEILAKYKNGGKIGSDKKSELERLKNLPYSKFLLEVLDSYKELNAEVGIKGYHQNSGEPIIGYFPNQYEYMYRSDSTGKPIRFFIDLGNEKYIHPFDINPKFNASEQKRIEQKADYFVKEGNEKYEKSIKELKDNNELDIAIETLKKALISLNIINQYDSSDIFKSSGTSILESKKAPYEGGNKNKMNFETYHERVNDDKLSSNVKNLDLERFKEEYLVGEFENIKLFNKWFINWYKSISKDMNISFSIPNELQPYKDKNTLILDAFEKKNQSIDAKKYFQEIIDKADEFDITIYLEPSPKHTFFIDNEEKKAKITKEYLITYYKNFGFIENNDNYSMKRTPKTFKTGGKIPNFSNMSKSEIKEFYDSPEGKKLDAETYAEWSKLVNMSKSELEDFYNSEEGKQAGLKQREADEQGISSGRESAKWILKMKDIPYTKWTPDMWRWAKKQISFIKRMTGVKGDLRDENNKPTRKLLALKIWGNNPEKFNNGGEIPSLIEKGIVELIFHETTPKHAEIYGLTAEKPLYIQTLYVKDDKRLKGIGEKVLHYIDSIAKQNGNDVIFGHINQKSTFIKDEKQKFNDVDMVKSWLHNNGYLLNEDNNDFHKVVTFETGGLIAPNGRKSNLTPEQYKLVRTPEFKAWFGDWENNPENASKVVDENGEPLVVYHGTDNDFNEFKPSVKALASHTKRTQPIFFSPNLQFASAYGRNVKSIFLNIRKLFYGRKLNQEQEDYFYDLILNDEIKKGTNEDSAIEHAYQTLRNLKLGSWGVLESDFMWNFYKQYNYNGFIVDEGYENYAVFDSNQIKIADGTNTTFDANNPDIRFETGGELKNIKYMNTVGKQLSLMDDETNEDYQTIDIFQGTEIETFAKGGGIGENQASFSIREVNNWDEVPVRWKNTSKINKINYKVDPKDKGLNDLMSKIVGNDALRPVFSGINFDENGATSTDAHRFLSIPAETEFRGVYKTLKSIQKTKGTDLIDGKYPNYQAVIPKEFSAVHQVDLYKLLQYCNVALNYANKYTKQIGLKVNEEMNIGLNAKFTIDVLTSFIKMGYDKAYFHFDTPSRAVVISNDKNPTLGKSTIGLIMPVMLNRGGDKYSVLGSMDIDYNLYLKPYFDFEKNEILNSDGSVADFKMNYGEDDVFTKEIVGIIKSITPSNSKLYILENFIVKNKTIKVTDLADSIEIKNIDVPDGIYRIENDAVIQSSLSIDDVDDYPKIAIIEDYDTIKINKDFFKWAIEKTKNYVGKDDLRPVMTGVNIQKKGGLLSITSTDAHLLATIDSTKYIKLNGIENDFSITVTPKNLFEAVKLMDSEEIEIAFTKDRYSDGVLKGSITVKFICSDVVYTTFSIEGKYPNYRAVIPYNNPKALLINMRDINSIVNSTEAKDFVSKNKKEADLIKIYGVELDGNINISIQATKGGYKQESKILGDKFLGKVGYDYDYETTNGNTCSLIMPVMKNEGLESNIFTFNAVLFGKFLDNLDGDILELGFSEPSRAYIVGERNLFYTEPKIKIKPKTEKVKSQIEKGLKVEQEHRETLEEIASGDITVDEAIKKTVEDHLEENPEYYEDLAKMERENKKYDWDSIINKFGEVYFIDIESDNKISSDQVKAEEYKWQFDRYSKYASPLSWKEAEKKFKDSLTKDELDSIEISYKKDEYADAEEHDSEKYYTEIIVTKKEQYEPKDISIKDLIEALEILGETELIEALMLLDDDVETFATGGEIENKSMIFEPTKTQDDIDEEIMETQFGKNI